MKKVALLGAPIGIGNRGVSALGASTIRLLREASPGCEVQLLIGDRVGGHRRILVSGQPLDVPVVPFRLSPRARLSTQMGWILILALLCRLCPFRSLAQSIRSRNAWLNAVQEADIVADIRGGDSFSDIYGIKEFVLGCLPAISVILTRGSIDMLPQTYGPLSHRISRVFARYILGNSRRILARDSEGPSAVRSILGGDRPVTVTPDVAFCLEAVQPAIPAIDPPLPTPKSATLVGINVNGLMYNGGYNRANMFGLKLDYPTFLRDLIVRLLAHPSVHILLVPHTFAPPHSVESDQEASRRVIAATPEASRSRLHMVVEEYDQNHIKGVIGLCDFFVGSRMHACIAALSQAVPCVGVAYSKKFLGVFDSVGMADWVIDGRQIDGRRAVDVVDEAFRSRSGRKDGLRDKVGLAQQRLREAFHDLVA